MLEFVDHALRNKRVGEGEFFINLFELCNLRCAFCWQNHEDRHGMNSILARADDVIATIKREGKASYAINTMGGELFFDDIPDELFNQYFLFAQKIHTSAVENNIEVNFNWVTNLIFTKRDRVVNLLNRITNELGTKATITTSYDFSGRFNVYTLEVFKQNLEYFTPWTVMVSLVLTKPNIEKMLEDDDSTFDEMYNRGVPMFFDYYSPEKNAETMAPSDLDLLKAFLYLINKYPNVYPIKDWIEREQNHMTCRGSTVITPYGKVGKCRSLIENEQIIHFKTEFDVQDNRNMEGAFIEKYDCLSCEYFQKCGLGCYLQHDFTLREELTTCPWKLMFHKIVKGEEPDLNRVSKI